MYDIIYYIILLYNKDIIWPSSAYVTKNKNK